MTPPATAAIAPGNRSRRSASRAAVRHPRRMSGPATGALSVALPAPLIALPGQRPLPHTPYPSRPARRPVGGSSRQPGLAGRASAAVYGVADSTLLDRLVRGRVWIGLLAFALIGIVAMQLVVLRLNTGIGHMLQRQAQLERQDAQIGVEDSLSASGDRVEPLASAAGMTIVAPGALHFVGIGPSDVSKATVALTRPVQAPTTEQVAGSTVPARTTEQAAASTVPAPTTGPQG